VQLTLTAAWAAAALQRLPPQAATCLCQCDLCSYHSPSHPQMALASRETCPLQLAELLLNCRQLCISCCVEEADWQSWSMLQGTNSAAYSDSSSATAPTSGRHLLQVGQSQTDSKLLTLKPPAPMLFCALEITHLWALQNLLILTYSWSTTSKAISSLDSLPFLV
jgi:hypothetical protein